MKFDGLKIAVSCAAGVALLWLFWMLGAVIFTASETEGRAGLVGDFFGGLNTLFAGLAFIGVVFTLYRQHQDAEEAETRRREDKSEEAAAHSKADELRRQDLEAEGYRRAEAQARHLEALEAQERISRIQAVTSLLNVEVGREASLREQLNLINRLCYQSESLLESVEQKQHADVTNWYNDMVLEIARGRKHWVYDEIEAMDNSLNATLGHCTDFARTRHQPTPHEMRSQLEATALESAKSLLTLLQRKRDQLSELFRANQESMGSLKSQLEKVMNASV